MEMQSAAQTPLNSCYCPHCGSRETETVKRRVGAAEKATVLLIPLFAVIGVVLGLFMFFFGMALIDIFDLGKELSLIGLCASFLLIMPAGGIVLGAMLGRGIIRRRRKRNNLSQTTYRCKMCKKIFIPVIKQ